MRKENLTSFSMRIPSVGTEMRLFVFLLLPLFSEQTAKSLVRLCDCANSHEPLLFAYVISNLELAQLLHDPT